MYQAVTILTVYCDFSRVLPVGAPVILRLSILKQIFLSSRVNRNIHMKEIYKQLQDRISSRTRS